MRKRNALIVMVVVAAAAACSSDAGGQGGTMTLPAIKTQPTAQAVVDEHLDAINKCDWNRLMAQYPPDVHFFLPGGTVVIGREAVGELFTGFCKDRSQGGNNGLIFTPQQTFKVGHTINVQWSADASFLTQPYLGADAYVTKAGLMYAQVTTFGAPPLPYK